MPFLLKNAIFDLDGTLVDSSVDILNCLASAYAANAVEGIDAAAIDKSVIGPPLWQLIRNLSPELADDRIARIVTCYRAAYDTCAMPDTHPCIGVPELLRYLRAAAVKLMVATNKPSLATRRVLQKTSLADYFMDVITVDTAPASDRSKHGMVCHLVEKWRLEKETTWVIGDGVGDIGAARSNGLHSIAVLSGYGKPGELRESGATVILESLNDLLSCGQFSVLKSESC